MERESERKGVIRSWLAVFAFKQRLSFWSATTCSQIRNERQGSPAPEVIRMGLALYVAVLISSTVLLCSVDIYLSILWDSYF